MNVMFSPFNLWKGQTGIELTKPFRLSRFESVEYGIRAAAKDLYGDYNKDGKHTIKALISEYAPITDGNNTNAYIEKVSQDLGIPSNKVFQMTDEILIQILITIGRVENGNLTWKVIPTETVAQVVKAQNFNYVKKKIIQ